MFVLQFVSDGEYKANRGTGFAKYTNDLQNAAVFKTEHSAWQSVPWNFELDKKTSWRVVPVRLVQV